MRRLLAAGLAVATAVVVVAVIVRPSSHTAAPTVVRHDLVTGTGTQLFTWTARANERITVAPAAAGPAPAVRVYRGTTARQQVASSAGGAAARTAPASFRARAGRTYELQVAPSDAKQPYRLLLVAAGGASVQAAKAQQKADDGPAVSCSPAPSGWSTTTVTIACTASSTVGLQDPSDAHFDLSATLPDGAESNDVATTARTVCDVDGACSIAGPVDGIALDRRPPTTACDPVPDDWQAADVTIHCVAEDGGSGLAQPSQSSLTFTASVPAGQAGRVTLPAEKVCDAAGNCSTVGPFGPIEIDKSTPVATCGPRPSGWVGRQATILCHVTDAGSGLADPTQSTVKLTTTVGNGAVSDAASTGSARVCSVVQTCVTVGPVKGLEVDLAPPTVSCVPPSGWSRGPVSVPCVARDDGAGLARGTGATFSLVGRAPKNTTGTRKVCDAVGNCAVAGPVAVQIDAKPPSVACSKPPAGWANTSVTVRCSAYDTASGLAHASDGSFSLVARAPVDGSTADARTGTRQVCSKVGVCATAGPITGIHIDTTKPHIACAPAPTGKVDLNVRVACTASDTGSGLRNAADSSFALATAVAAGRADSRAQTSSRAVCSKAGTCVTAGPFTVDVDRAAPAAGNAPVIVVPKRATVLVASSGPLAGGASSYPSPTAHDDLGESLPVACNPGPSTGLAPGWTPVSCSATDGADRQTVSSFPVVVKVDPALGSSGTAAAGRPWAAAGVGYAPGSSVSVSLDGTTVAKGEANAHGVAAVRFTVPAGTARGLHAVAVAGRDAAGDPVTSLASLRTGPTETGTPPHPATNATEPADPSPAPQAQPVSHFALRRTTAGKSPSPGSSGSRSWLLLIVLLAAALALAGAVVLRSRRRRPPEPPASA